MGTPRRSRLLDYVDPVDSVDHVDPDLPAPPAADRPPVAEPRRSRLLDYIDQGDPVEAAEAATGSRPGIPAYHTPVFVPAHPRYLDTDDASGTATRVPFIAYELFAHPADGTVALAFTTLDRLVAALGEAQPWVATSLGPLAEGVGELGVTVRLDPRLAPGPPNWQPADVTGAGHVLSETGEDDVRMAKDIWRGVTSML